jgi:hypothetical protein
MTAEELKEKIKVVVRQVYGNPKRATGDYGETASDELTKFPELKDVLVKLMTEDFKVFIESIDWVAPKPTTFRINLKNGQSFYLTYTTRSWIAQVEGKKYYLLNINELQNATNSIARVLRYGTKETTTEETETEVTATATEKPAETPAAGEEAEGA